MIRSTPSRPGEPAGLAARRRESRRRRGRAARRTARRVPARTPRPPAIAPGPVRPRSRPRRTPRGRHRSRRPRRGRARLPASASVMYSAPSAATIGRHDAGVATVTRPAPDRSAASAASAAAPVLPARSRHDHARGRSRPCASPAERGSTSARIDVSRQHLDPGTADVGDDRLGNADVGNDELAGERLAGRQHERKLRRAERDGQRGAARPGRRPRADPPTGRSADRSPRPAVPPSSRRRRPFP